MRILSYRARSEAEVNSLLLRKGFTAPVTQQTVKRLRLLRYTNDELFAQNWARSRAADRGYGPQRIERELRDKGIASDLIRRAIREAFSESDERTRAEQTLRKRFRDNSLNDPRTYRQAAMFLQRRGYNDSVIYNLLRRYED